MVENGEDFALRKNGEETRNLVNKHQNPLSYIFSQLIEGFVEEPRGHVYTQDLKKAIKCYAKDEGIDLTLNSKGDIPSKKLLNVIRNEYDLWDIKYGTEPHEGKRYYPCLSPNELYLDILKNNPETL